ncbi:MAG: hypothetical protein JKY61_05745 [Planctomycetes bacterium]|nr:hypothetical protein [Planctomycetota bacterium]
MRIAILRRPDGLYEFRLERIGIFQVPKDGEGLDCVGQYSEEVVPFDIQRWVGDGERLSGALRSVRVGRLSSQLLIDTVEVLDHTIPDRDSFSKGLAWPKLEKGVEKPARTAAHPRGFKGTKVQPPEAPSPKRFDLLPYLDGGAHEDGVIGALAGFGETRPYRMSHWSPDNVEAARKLPSDFYRYFMWVAQLASWDQVVWLIALYWDFNLMEELDLKRLIAQIHYQDGFHKVVPWVDSMRVLAPARRVAFAELVFEARARVDTDADLDAIVSRLDLLCTDENFRSRAHYLLLQASDGPLAHEVLDQFELLNEFHPRGCLSEVEASVGAAATVRRVVGLLCEGADDWAWSGYCTALLEACGDFDGFATFLSGAPLQGMGPDTAYEYLQLFTSLYHYDCDWEETEEKWVWMRGQAAGWAGAVLAVEVRYRPKFLDYLSTLLWEWDSPKELEARIGPMVPWVSHLCAAPFSEKLAGDYTFSRIGYFASPGLHEALQAPDAALLALEKVVRRDNDDRMAGDGLWVLVSMLPDLVLAGLKAGSGALASAARSLGSLAKDDGMQVMGELRRSDLFAVDPESSTTQRLVQSLLLLGPPSAQTLVSRNVRRHFDGIGELGEQQVVRAGSKIRAAWSDVLLGAVSQRVLEVLAERVGAQPGNISSQENHALRMMFAAEDNRRMLRKVLQKHFAGDRDYIRNHPINQEWLSQHANIKGSAWCAGFERSHRSEPFGSLTIALEFDPLEVLRVGTYVGTCLGLGGSFMYSAAAIMMDGNKHVAYCRDSRGVVLARQILVLTEDDCLCCCEVYPYEGSEELAGFFAEFDRALAKSLGIKIHDPEDEGADDVDDRILTLLSSSWWDDGPVQVSAE